MTEESGRLLGRHFVLLKRRKGDEIFVVDPSRPLKNITYTVTRHKIEGWGRRVFLVPPPKVKSTDTLEVDTIFTLRIKKHGAPGKAPEDLAELKKRIDEAAATLRTSSELRSPRSWRAETAAFGLPGLDLPAEYGGNA